MGKLRHALAYGNFQISQPGIPRPRFRYWHKLLKIEMLLFADRRTLRKKGYFSHFVALFALWGALRSFADVAASSAVMPLVVIFADYAAELHRESFWKNPLPRGVFSSTWSTILLYLRGLFLYLGEKIVDRAHLTYLFAANSQVITVNFFAAKNCCRYGLFSSPNFRVAAVIAALVV